jgi:hypothetical protein
MIVFEADSVGVFVDADYGEGWVDFRWPDRIYGHDGLHVDIDSHCSRERGMWTGSGFESVELWRDRLRLQFPPQLARKLEFDHEIEIAFSLSNEQFSALHVFITNLIGTHDLVIHI